MKSRLLIKARGKAGTQPRGSGGLHPGRGSLRIQTKTGVNNIFFFSQKNIKKTKRLELFPPAIRPGQKGAGVTPPPGGGGDRTNPPPWRKY